LKVGENESLEASEELEKDLCENINKEKSIIHLTCFLEFELG